MFCPKCGNKLQSGYLFCNKCGADIKTYNLVNRADDIDIVDLVDRAKSGDESAFHQLYEKTNKRNYYIALKMVKTDADAQDVLQDAYIRIYKNLDKFQYQGEGSFDSWTSKIVSNTALNHLRKKQMVLFSDIEADQEGDFSLEIEDEDISRQPELAYDKKETSQIVQELLGTLSDEQRVCAMMFYFQEESVKDIASEIGCSENTIKSRLNYARKNMMAKAEELKKKGILTGILSLAGLIAIIRSKDAMAMEHVPSGVYSAVSESIKWSGVVESASSISGASAGVASSEGAVSGGAISGSATVGGTSALGAATAGGTVAVEAAVTAGISIKMIVAIIVTSVLLVTGGVTTFVMTRTPDSEETKVEANDGIISEETDVISGSSVDKKDEANEKTPKELFQEFIKQYLFLVESGKSYSIKSNYSVLDDGSYEYNVDIPEEVRNNPIGYDIDDYDNDGIVELLIVNHFFEMDEYGYERSRIALEMYEDVDGEVVQSDKIDDFQTSENYDSITGRISSIPGKFEVVKLYRDGELTVFVEEYEQAHGEGESGYIAFSYMKYDGSSFTKPVGASEVEVDPSFDTEKWNSLGEYGIKYTTEELWKGRFPTEKVSDRRVVFFVNATQKSESETIVVFSAEPIAEEKTVSVKQIKKAYKDFFENRNGILSVESLDGPSMLDIEFDKKYKHADTTECLTPREIDVDLTEFDIYQLVDINNDGIDEMIMSTYAPNEPDTEWMDKSIDVMILTYDEDTVKPIIVYTDFLVKSTGYSLDSMFIDKDGLFNISINRRSVSIEVQYELIGSSLVQKNIYVWVWVRKPTPGGEYEVEDFNYDFKNGRRIKKARTINYEDRKTIDFPIFEDVDSND